MKAEPKEKPILFSGPMVCAILAGKKTQTRRVVAVNNSFRQASPNSWPFDLSRAWRDPGFPHLCGGMKCEYLHVPFCHPEEGWEEVAGNDTVERWYSRFQPHQRLWVRETWQETDETINDTPGIVYRATDPDWSSMEGWKWRPSIYMPRAASRITLKVTGIRVERLRDISAKDIIAEGAVERQHFRDDLGKMPVSAFDGKCYLDLRSLWQSGWDSINAKRGFGWKTNPWVWVIEFKRV